MFFLLFFVWFCIVLIKKTYPHITWNSDYKINTCFKMMFKPFIKFSLSMNNKYT